MNKQTNKQTNKRKSFPTFKNIFKDLRFKKKIIPTFFTLINIFYSIKKIILIVSVGKILFDRSSLA